MNAQYRFLRTHHGITTFARVEMEAITGCGHGVEVIEQLPTSPDRDNGEANRQWDAPWVDAAISGIRSVLEYLQSLGVSLDGWQFHLVKIVGTYVDTREDAVRCAAAMATLQLVSESVHLPPAKVAFVGNQWSLEFPEVVTPAAVQGPTP